MALFLLVSAACSPSTLLDIGDLEVRFSGAPPEVSEVRITVGSRTKVAPWNFGKVRIDRLSTGTVQVVVRAFEGETEVDRRQVAAVIRPEALTIVAVRFGWVPADGGMVLNDLRDSGADIRPDAGPDAEADAGTRDEFDAGNFDSGVNTGNPDAAVPFMCSFDDEFQSEVFSVMFDGRTALASDGGELRAVVAGFGGRTDYVEFLATAQQKLVRPCGVALGSASLSAVGVVMEQLWSSEIVVEARSMSIAQLAVGSPPSGTSASMSTSNSDDILPEAHKMLLADPFDLVIRGSRAPGGLTVFEGMLELEITFSVYSDGL